MRMNYIAILLLIFLTVIIVAPGEVFSQKINVVSCDDLHTVVLLDDGTVWSWGFNMFGQCGVDNSTSIVLYPVQVPISNVTDIAAGGSFTMALKADGTVWSWGKNSFGQLGIPINKSHPNIVMVPGLANITAISAGYDYGMALKDDGTVWTWGCNIYGQLGDGKPFNQSFSNNTEDGYYSKPTNPGFLEIPGHVDNISAILEKMPLNNSGYITVDDELSKRYSAHNSSPGKVSLLSNIELIGAGRSTAIAIDNDGVIWAWGSYRLNYSTHEFSTPVRLGILKNVVNISNNALLTSDNKVWVLSYSGKKLDSDPNSPPYDLNELQGLANIKSINSGDDYYIALRKDGTVWSWGENHWGQLGDGTNKSKSAPSVVPGISNITSIGAGSAYTIAVSDDGTIWGWGDDNSGQIGDGEYGNSLYRKSPVMAKFTSSMEPNTFNVTPIPEVSDFYDPSLHTPLPNTSNIIDNLISGLSSNYIVIGLTSILLLVCSILYLSLRGKT